MQGVPVKLRWNGQQFSRVPGPSRPVDEITVLLELCNLSSSPLARHSFFSQSTGTGGRPFSVFPQQHPWQMVRCPITSRFVARGCVDSADISSRLVLCSRGRFGK